MEELNRFSDEARLRIIDAANEQKTPSDAIGEVIPVDPLMPKEKVEDKRYDVLPKSDEDLRESGTGF